MTPVSSSPLGPCVRGLLPHYTFILFLFNHLSQGEHWPRVTKEVVVAGPQEEDETRVCSRLEKGVEVGEAIPLPQHGSRAR